MRRGLAGGRENAEQLKRSRCVVMKHSIDLTHLWKRLDPDAMSDYAAQWLAETRLPRAERSNVSQRAITVSLIAPADQQWLFIQAAVRWAESDRDLGNIAAVSLEGLLGRYGDACIEAVEDEASRDAKFARMVTMAWQFTMSDEVWTRLQAIQSEISD